jgi:ferrous iron transport protein A
MQLDSAIGILERFDSAAIQSDTGFVMQSSVKKPRDLTHLKKGESAILDRIDLNEREARRLMEMGFVPGHSVTAAHSAPGGDPRVFQVDGSEVALRCETARRLLIRK